MEGQGLGQCVLRDTEDKPELMESICSQPGIPTLARHLLCVPQGSQSKRWGQTPADASAGKASASSWELARPSFCVATCLSCGPRGAEVASLVTGVQSKGHGESD